MDKQLKKYAELLVQYGANVQKNQLVVITIDVENVSFAHMLRDAAYDAGAGEVFIDWIDEQSNLARYLRADNDVFDNYHEWMAKKYLELDEKGAVYIHIVSSDPELLESVDPDRINRYVQIASQKNKEHSSHLMSCENRWVIGAFPSIKWGEKVFPKLKGEKAKEALLELILKCSRIDLEDPVESWKKENNLFEKRKNYLNNIQFKALHFSNSLGTDLVVGLAKDHLWAGFGNVDKNGIDFSPNLPTAEIYSAPHRDKVNGTVVASMPLAFQGNLIEGIQIEFVDGKAVKYKATKNENLLKILIETDESSSFLGEVALVPKSSPIGESGTIFYNTLFDENMSCHLALGQAYSSCIKDSDKMTLDELKSKGLNESLIHVDFMFGTPDIRVCGELKNGEMITLMEDGEFLF